jgi:predicted ribosome-associated RNA-binding protein Tma20
MSQRIKVLREFNSTVGNCKVGDIILVDDETAAQFIAMELAEETADEMQTADAAPIKKRAAKWDDQP